MVSILQVDGLGKRYGLLPSEVLKRGNTFDLYVMDCVLTFERFHNKKAENKGQVPPEFYSEEQLMEIMKRGKEE